MMIRECFCTHPTPVIIITLYYNDIGILYFVNVDNFTLQKKIKHEGPPKFVVIILIILLHSIFEPFFMNLNKIRNLF